MNTIKIEYACIDGMHFFVSGDSLSKGVLAGHEDLKTAFEEVSVQLDYLLEKNHGLKAKCDPAEPFEEFLKWLDAVMDIQHGSSIVPMPAAIIDWMQQQAA